MTQTKLARLGLALLMTSVLDIAAPSAARAADPPKLGCIANGITPQWGVNWGSSLAGDEIWAPIEGDPLLIAVGSRGSIAVWACQPGGSAPTRQYFSEDDWGTNVFLDGARHASRYPALSGSGATRFTAVSQLVTRDVNTWTASTVVDLGVAARLTRIITYTLGSSSYRIRWELTNSSAGTFNDVRLIHGGDAFFGGVDSARSWWNAGQNMVYVNNTSFSSSGIMGFFGSPATPADRHFGGEFSTGNGQAASGQLEDSADSNFVDAGYHLQWTRGALAPASTWVIEAFEVWTDPSYVQVLAPAAQLSPPGTTVSMSFVVHNLDASAHSFSLAALSDLAWATRIVGDAAITLPALGSAPVEVEIIVPGAAAVDAVSRVTLTATESPGTAIGSSSATLTVFRPDYTIAPSPLDLGRLGIGETATAAVTLANSGDDVVLGTVGSPNGLAAPFAIVSDGCSNQTIVNGATCTIQVSFTGPAVGVFTDVFNIPVLAPTVTSVSVAVMGEVGPFVIDNSTGAATYDQGRAAVLVDPSVLVTGPAELDGAKVSIATGFVAAEDRLSFIPMHGITGTYDAATGILSLTGSATPSEYQELLRTVSYDNVAPGVPTHGARSVRFSLGAGGLYFEDNGHFYEFVIASAISWTAARDAASARRYFGLVGYLTTVTSAAENTFVAGKLAGQGWLGASDAATETIWRWSTGPEGLEANGLGRHFFTQVGSGGNAVGGEYHNWAAGEPNNAGGEDYAHFLANGQWNDYPLSLGSITGYVVEYGGMPGDPSNETVDSRAVNVATCADALASGNETDVDCGGPVCESCPDGDGCLLARDCQSSVCTGDVCQAPTCVDLVANGTETDVDCGSACPDCPDGDGCAVAGDCQSGVCTGDVCQVPTCSDTVDNGLESDVDCGGACPDCADGQHCSVAGDCQSDVCTGGVCQVPTCVDRVANGTETDIDCGSSCAPCPDGDGCSIATDCQSAVCNGGACQVPSCVDRVKNGSETDLDCGGLGCAGCDDGEVCALADDCASKVCAHNLCQVPTCDDATKNGSEGDVDCGGECAPCVNGQSCNEAADCVSKVCTDGECRVPTCSDGVRNGAESDVDCGGGVCADCANGRACLVVGDCVSGWCGANVCKSPTCTDGAKNGEETDLDCGGPSCGECADLDGCKAATDCSSGVCKAGICQPPSCTDAVLNGSETDRDCGGATCGDCADDEQCDVAGDCASGVCKGQVCRAPTCTDSVKNGAETDVDCGGDCGDCADGEGCGVGTDCVSGVCTGAVCQVPTCRDGVANGTETDVDCGGAACGDCADLAACREGGDCASGVCVVSICRVPTCVDLVKNGVETDTDCGGVCAGCASGEDCAFGRDCASGVCAGELCQAPSCVDAVKNGAETDTDCGGTCGGCDDGEACAVAGDCQSAVCAGALCRAATCLDGVGNGLETDVDCGGPCAACADGEACAGDSDCLSQVCAGARCQEPTCTDAVKNGSESDLDCGGACAGCADGGACGSGADCESGLCASDVCLAPSCTDRVANGGETGLDCGGSCAPCAVGEPCAVGLDCVSGVCSGALCRAATCEDDVPNGDETDVDCGGACEPCADALGCLIAIDCASGVCVEETCAAPECGDGVANGTEDCDDANLGSGDGCSEACAVEPGWTCAPGLDGVSGCAATCGDARIALPVEACDDGGDSPGDGCSATCTIEDGWACTGPAGGPSTCGETCGDGLLDSELEQCDDGGAVAGDGCGACRVEPGWECDGAPSRCVLVDTDLDGVRDDGDSSGAVGDHFCGGGTVTECDDNCREVPNIDQADLDADGQGDACDDDIDDDGVSNAVELADGTDPANPDSDGDGKTDGEEKRAGTDPLVPGLIGIRGGGSGCAGGGRLESLALWAVVVLAWRARRRERPQRGG